jgi:hypothetical protein
MITRAVSVKGLILPLVIIAGLASCTKEKSMMGDDSAVTASSTIAVEASARGSASGDSIYVLCGSGTRVNITESELPASATAYLTANYTGYTFKKAAAKKDNSGNVTAYIAIIFYNDKPVAIEFDASGNFVRVLEQRERGDLHNPGGFHDGGRFRHRDGRCRDTIALNLLPVSILTYMVTNYPQDTLVKAFVNAHDTTYVVISQNNGLFANVFSSTGTFIRRVALPTPHGHCVLILQSALPANVLSYLTSTYPNYVFERAFAAYANGAVQGYVVIITANNTHYAVKFDAAGNFVAVRVIW